MNHRSYHLELRSRDDFRPKAFPTDDFKLTQNAKVEVERCRRHWREVGEGFWNDREDWTEPQWRRYLARDDVSFWIAEHDGEDIGFFELVMTGSEMKIEGFGLLPTFRGRGLGGGLLSAATQQAFDLGAQRIWLHTATDDHPGALPNYLKRGYRVFRDEELHEPMPGAPSPRSL